MLNKDIYYVKIGSLNYGIFSNLEPISEVIATHMRAVPEKYFPQY